MNLFYKDKIKKNDILTFRTNKALRGDVSLLNFKKELNHLLLQGDNFEIMKSLIKKYKLTGTVDLVYIDPPFSTNTIFRIDDARVSTISSGKNGKIAYTDTLKGVEFLEFLRQRLILIRELMSEKASIYLHIDYKVGHYVKVIMDEVFGIKNFRNDITRIKCNPKNFKRNGYGNIKDLILFYTKTNNFIWNEPMENRDNKELKRLFNKTDEHGRQYTTNPLHAPGETENGKTGQKWKGINPPKGRHWRYGPEVLDKLDKNNLIEWSRNGVPRKKIYIEDYQTKRVQDIWKYKDKPNPIYPTEKNLDLLERIVKTSSQKNDLVMDCFCGSGGFLYTADNLDRRWIGIDSSNEAIEITTKRFEANKNLFSKKDITRLIL